jgi:hypothetical protein
MIAPSWRDRFAHQRFNYTYTLGSIPIMKDWILKQKTDIKTTKMNVDLMAVKVMKIVEQHKKNNNTVNGGYHFLSVLVRPVPEMYLNTKYPKIRDMEIDMDNQLTNSDEYVEIVLWNQLGISFQRAFHPKKNQVPIITRFNNLQAKLYIDNTVNPPISKISFNSCDKYHPTEWYFFD